MKRIVFIISSYEINGVCTVVKNLVDNLDKNKFKIVLFIEKIQKRHFPIDKDIKVINIDLKPRQGLFENIKNVWGILKSIQMADTTERPDAFLSFGSLPNCYTLLALRLFKKSKAKVIITEHSEALFVPFRQRELKRRILAPIYKVMIYFLYRLADYIIPVSENIAKLVRRLFFVKAERVKVIHNPVDISNIRDLSMHRVDDIDFQDHTHYLAAISRLSPEKGIEYLMQAIAGLKSNVNLKLLLIGEGERAEELKGLSADYDIGNRVRFLGWQDNPFKYLSKCDAFVLPSVYEGFPNVILEAMACGVPIIATRCTPAIEEVIDSYNNGILVPPKNAGALSKEINNLLDSKTLREKIRSNAYEKVKGFDVSRVVKRYEEILSI